MKIRQSGESFFRSSPTLCTLQRTNGGKGFITSSKTPTKPGPFVGVSILPAVRLACWPGDYTNTRQGILRHHRLPRLGRPNAF